LAIIFNSTTLFSPMLPFDTTLAFFAASLVLAAAPGPDNVFVLLHAASHGRRAGLLAVLGLCSGLLVHTAAVALGLAAMLAASPRAFTALTMLGAAYLLWLAWQSWRAPVGTLGSPATPVLSDAQTLRRGVMMNVSNPKVAIFFVAFLPQFADPARGNMVLQICLLGSVFMLAALLVFGAIAYFAATLAQPFLRSTRAQRGLNRFASAVFVALALRLALG
jgi:threonine/homoserine/homoserine lactone efflux protein